MLCPCCGKPNGRGFNELCPRCEVWIETRHKPDIPVSVDTGGTTRQILNLAAYATGRLQKIRRFVVNLHW